MHAILCISFGLAAATDGGALDTVVGFEALSLIQVETRSARAVVADAGQLATSAFHNVTESHKMHLQGPANESDDDLVSRIIPAKILKGAHSGNEVVQAELGINFDSQVDVLTLVSSFSINAVLSLVFFLLFLLLQRWQERVYWGNVLDEKAPDPRDSWFGLWLKLEEVEKYAGLDAAMFVEFCNLGMLVSAAFGIPLCLGLCPVYYLVEKQLANEAIELAHAEHRNITAPSEFSISMPAIPASMPWLRWALAAVVWVVVIGLQYMLSSAQRRFVKRRVNWLSERPKPESTTLMVSQIPRRFCTDDQLREYFNKLFPDGAIEDVYVVKELGHLAALIEQFSALEDKLRQAQFKWKRMGSDSENRPTLTLANGEMTADEIDHFSNEANAVLGRIRAERNAINNADNATQLAICGSVAFVTFKQMRDAEMALQLRLESRGDIFVMEYPPSPGDVRYRDLLRGPRQRMAMHILGYFCIFLVFVLFFPVVGALSSVLNLESLKSIKLVDNILTSHPLAHSLLEGIFATLVLSIIMGFLPSILNFTILNTFTLKADALSQYYLQQWYFWFQVVFVLLVTAVGSSLWDRAKEIVASPKSVLFILAASLPRTSGFYMNYVVLQWSVTVLQMSRYVNLLKFLGWKAVIDEKRAKENSEPEDGDYYGIGSRSARQTLILVTGLVFCVLLPVILIAVFLFFFVSRLVFSYLLVYAETHKIDMGGYYWQLQLRHVQLCIPIFVITMSGVLWVSSDEFIGPGTVALLSLTYWLYEYSAWMDTLWETLPFRAVAEASAKEKTVTPEVYRQKELALDLDRMLSDDEKQI